MMTQLSGRFDPFSFGTFNLTSTLFGLNTKSSASSSCWSKDVRYCIRGRRGGGYIPQSFRFWLTVAPATALEQVWPSPDLQPSSASPAVAPLMKLIVSGGD